MNSVSGRNYCVWPVTIVRLGLQLDTATGRGPPQPSLGNRSWRPVTIDRNLSALQSDDSINQLDDAALVPRKGVGAHSLLVGRDLFHNHPRPLGYGRIFRRLLSASKGLTDAFCSTMEAT